MAVISQDLVGRDVFARDGSKVGQIKELVYGDEYVGVRRSLFSTIVVPVGVLDDSGGRLTIPLTASYLDMAPKVNTKKELSPRDKGLIDRFYMPKAA